MRVAAAWAAAGVGLLLLAGPALAQDAPASGCAYMVQPPGGQIEMRPAEGLDAIFTDAEIQPPPPPAGALLDAPVSGGSEGAARGTLSIMVGGAAADFQRALPVFQAMGKTITHVGPVGAGQTVKLVNQVLVVGNCLAMCEAMLLAQAGGVDLQKAYDAVSQGAAGSWMFTNRAPQIMRRDWRPGFTIDLQQKDLRLVLEAAQELQVPLLGTSLIASLYTTLQARGLGAEGNHALVKALEQLAGVTVGAAAGPHC